MVELSKLGSTPRIWAVGALCRATAEALDARFNPVAVRGEVSSLSRAASGHCYFTLKDAQGQLRCAMFRRAAGLLDFMPRDGDMVEVQGRLGVYEPRGDLQLIVESMSRAGQGVLLEQFLQLKARLQAEGLFDSGRKRAVPALPRGIGLVTSLGAAALHDVVSTLQRRAPHVPVMLAPAAVQGSAAPAELMLALEQLYALAQKGRLDVIVLVRGGGAMEDLWAFNDEHLARTIVRSPVPVVCGVGHETDFTIADFCADLRAPTPTAAAELAAQPLDTWLTELALAHDGLRMAVLRRTDVANQRLDSAVSRLGRPSARMAEQQLRLERSVHRLRYAGMSGLQQGQIRWKKASASHAQALQRRVLRTHETLARTALRLELLDPRLVLQRGYAWLSDRQGDAVTSVRQTGPGQTLRATLADGQVDLAVLPRGED